MSLAFPAQMDFNAPNLSIAGVLGSPDDAALMRSIAERDRHAVELLYDRHAPRVLAVCRRILHDAGDAEDVLTEVFFELWTRADRFDPSRGSVLAYVLTLARSRSIDRKRSLSSRKAGASASSLPDYLGDAEQSSVEPDPLAAVESDEQGILIRRALQALDPKQREALECSYFEGLTHSEIAEKLQKPLGTVKTYIRQGLIHMKEQFRNQG